MGEKRFLGTGLTQNGHIVAKRFSDIHLVSSQVTTQEGGYHSDSSNYNQKSHCAFLFSFGGRFVALQKKIPSHLKG